MDSIAAPTMGRGKRERKRCRHHSLLGERWAPPSGATRSMASTVSSQWGLQQGGSGGRQKVGVGRSQACKRIAAGGWAQLAGRAAPLPRRQAAPCLLPHSPKQSACLRLGVAPGLGRLHAPACRAPRTAAHMCCPPRSRAILAAGAPTTAHLMSSSMWKARTSRGETPASTALARYMYSPPRSGRRQAV